MDAKAIHVAWSEHPMGSLGRYQQMVHVWGGWELGGKLFSDTVPIAYLVYLVTESDYLVFIFPCEKASHKSSALDHTKFILIHVSDLK